MEFAILGPLTAHAAGESLPLGPFKQRVVLGLLLCQANRTVSVAALSDALWDDDPPRTAHKNLQVYVSALRRMFGAEPAGAEPATLLHTPPGYTLRLGPQRLDALRFRDLARTGRHAAQNGDVATAADLLGQAVRLWRGPMLPDLVSILRIAIEAKQLREQYLTAYEDWTDAKLALGHHADLVESVDELARRHPYRERLRYAQMLALYRSGRQTEALARFDSLRQSLAKELGLQPSPVLTRLYESILAGDQGLDVIPAGRLAPISVRAVAAERTSLTRDIADFTGRARRIDQLLELLRSPRPGGVTTITGPTGVGKSALAVHCAHQVGDHFPGGRVLVCLRSRDGQGRPTTEVLGDLLRGLGWTGTLPDDCGERAALVRESVSGRATLFVLDDAVDVEQIRSVTTAVGDGSVVVTSRRHLGGLESAVHLVVDPMADAEALELLSRLIDPNRVKDEPDAARRLVASCHGLPLLVRIVGAKLNGLRHLSLARYAGRLADRRLLLDELVAGDLQVRSRLAQSLRDVTSDDRAVLRQLAAMPESTFTAADAAIVLRTGVVEAERAIERLIEAHLVQASAEEVEMHVYERDVRYALHALVQVLVSERHPA